MPTRRSTRFSPQWLRRQLEPHRGGGRLWIAYSGGLDSSVLLHAAVACFGQRRESSAGSGHNLRASAPTPDSIRALETASRPAPWSGLHAIHVDHGLHPDSAAWAAHCRAVAERLGVPLSERRLRLRRKQGDSLEALARAARYAVFAELLAPGDLLATAQHRDDQAETLLLALLRGSGVHGLASMPAVANLGSGRLLRPLLGVSRADLLDYAEREGVAWIDDPSNADVDLDRNRLRHHVIPSLRRRWPSLDLTLARAAGHCAEAAELLDEAADDWLARLDGQRPGTLSVEGLRGLSPARCRWVLRRWLTREGFRPPASVVLDRILAEVMAAALERTPLVAWPGCEVRRYRDDLYALPPLPERPDVGTTPASTATLIWDGRASLTLPHGLGMLQLPHAAVEVGELAIRFGCSGLRCRVGHGPSRALKPLYQRAGVPPWLRAYVPLLMRADELAAIAGVTHCDARLAGLRWSGHPWERFGFFQPAAPAR